MSNDKLFKGEFKLDRSLLRLLKRLQDLLSARDRELPAFLDVCDGDREVVGQESEPLRAHAQTFVREIELEVERLGVRSRSVGEELHVLVLGVGLRPRLHDEGVVNCMSQRKQVLSWYGLAGLLAAFGRGGHTRATWRTDGIQSV